MTLAASISWNEATDENEGDNDNCRDLDDLQVDLRKPMKALLLVRQLSHLFYLDDFREKSSIC